MQRGIVAFNCICIPMQVGRAASAFQCNLLAVHRMHCIYRAVEQAPSWSCDRLGMSPLGIKLIVRLIRVIRPSSFLEVSHISIDSTIMQL